MEVFSSSLSLLTEISIATVDLEHIKGQGTLTDPAEHLKVLIPEARFLWSTVC